MYITERMIYVFECAPDHLYPEMGSGINGISQEFGNQITVWEGNFNTSTE